MRTTEMVLFAPFLKTSKFIPACISIYILSLLGLHSSHCVQYIICVYLSQTFLYIFPWIRERSTILRFWENWKQHHLWSTHGFILWIKVKSKENWIEGRCFEHSICSTTLNSSAGKSFRALQGLKKENVLEFFFIAEKCECV